MQCGKLELSRSGVEFWDFIEVLVMHETHFSSHNWENIFFFFLFVVLIRLK